MSRLLHGVRIPLITNAGGIRYLLRDEFATDLAAPLPATFPMSPGPGIWTPRDVEGKISIASGWANFGAQATAVYSEEDLVCKDIPITRTPGRLIICKWKCTTDGPQYPLALVTSTTPAWNHTNVEAGFWRSAANTLSVISNAALGPAVTAFVADGTEYLLAIALRAAGAKFYIKGGAYTYWRELYPTTTGSTATLYLAAAGNTAVFAVSFLRGPATAWLDSPLVSDGFSARLGILAISMDDDGNMDDWLELADDAAAYGYKISLNLETDPAAGAISAPEWAALQTKFDAGHDITSHTRTHPDLSSLDGLTIQYVGTGTACAMTIAGNALTTAVTAGPGGEDLNIDLTNASYDKLTELKNYIDGLGAYTCALGNANTTQTKTVNLADVAGQDIRTAPYTALLDATKYYADEITGSKADLEANLTGYTCKVLTYPHGNSSAGSRAAALAAGYLGGRNTTAQANNLYNIPDIFLIKAYSPTAAFGDPPDAATINTFLSGLCTNGQAGVIVAHDFATNYSRAYWATVLAAINAWQTANPGKLQVKTLSDAVQYIVDNGTTADSVAYTRIIDPGSSDGLGHAEGVAGSVGTGGGGKTYSSGGATWGVGGAAAFNAPTEGVENCNDSPFDNAAQWTAQAGWTVAGGIATRAATAGTNLLTNTGGTAAVVGGWYRIEADVIRNAGSVFLGMGSNGLYAFSSSGAKVETLRCTSAGKPLIYAGNTFAGTVDNFSVKRSTLNTLFSAVQLSTADIFASIELTIAMAFQGGMVINLDSVSSPSNFLLAYYNVADGKVYLSKCLGGTWSNIAGFPATAGYSAGAGLAVRKIGLIYYVWYNGVLIGTWTADAGTDANIVNNTLHGRFSTGNGPSEVSLDNFVVYLTGAGGEYDILNKWSN